MQKLRRNLSMDMEFYGISNFEVPRNRVRIFLLWLRLGCQEQAVHGCWTWIGPTLDGTLVVHRGQMVSAVVKVSVAREAKVHQARLTEEGDVSLKTATGVKTARLATFDERLDFHLERKGEIDDIGQFMLSYDYPRSSSLRENAFLHVYPLLPQ